MSVASAKLLLALMPPSQPFFKLSLQQAARQQLVEMSADPQAELSRADVALSDIEQQVLKKMDKLKARTALFGVQTPCGGRECAAVCLRRDQDVQLAQLRES